MGSSVQAGAACARPHGLPGSCLRGVCWSKGAKGGVEDGAGRQATRRKQPVERHVGVCAAGGGRGAGGGQGCWGPGGGERPPGCAAPVPTTSGGQERGRAPGCKPCMALPPATGLCRRPPAQPACTCVYTAHHTTWQASQVGCKGVLRMAWHRRVRTRRSHPPARVQANDANASDFDDVTTPQPQPLMGIPQCSADRFLNSDNCTEILYSPSPNAAVDVGRAPQQRRRDGQGRGGGGPRRACVCVGGGRLAGAGGWGGRVGLGVWGGGVRAGAGGGGRLVSGPAKGCGGRWAANREGRAGHCSHLRAPPSSPFHSSTGLAHPCVVPLCPAAAPCRPSWHKSRPGTQSQSG